jgi:hypothetical protein
MATSWWQRPHEAGNRPLERTAVPDPSLAPRSPADNGQPAIRPAEPARSERPALSPEVVAGLRDARNTRLRPLAEAPAGPCRRVRQLVADGDQPERPVSEHLAYLWLFPDYGAGVILATAFSDLVQAGRWRPVLDDLATTGVTLRQPSE